MKRLVSILIPAYNAEDWIASAIQSAIAQTWQYKEIIVVNDGSRDRTGAVARRFASKTITVVSTENQGLSAAVNHAYRLSQGDYIQELDADDILLPNKIQRQLGALREGESRRILLSSPWAPFYYRTDRARFVHNSVCQDLSPLEWLERKMGDNVHMQNATWLMSRELAEAAGPWDTNLHYDQDGEYFCRVLLASEGVRFVPETGIYYRNTGTNSVSYIGTSDKKRDSLLVSMKLHIQYLRSLEESERTRIACLQYLQDKSIYFYPDRPDIIAELQAIAAQFQGHLKVPRLRWKYAWMEPIFGLKTAKWAQTRIPQMRASLVRRWDKAMMEI
jgi:glycosyltransferase involved in cell wall biosynthesis